ncbi:MAG: hypothetical protein GY807_12775 [Gammaproteobacteria bacterium]|nr:hypothetical protein [Gammaproteobacteria bacterium]
MLEGLRSIVLAMSDIGFLFCICPSIGIAGIGLGLLWRGLHRTRLIEGVPTSKVRSAAQGYTELVGMAKLIQDSQIVSPLSGRSCVWYDYTIQENVGMFSHKRLSVNSNSSDNLFVLEDDTGQCVIDPEGAEIQPSKTSIWYGNTAWPEHGPLGAYGILSLGHRYRYTERIIKPGDTLYAIGYFITQGTDYQGELKHDIGAILRAWKNDPQKMRSLDLNQDGNIDMQEWARARRSAEKEAIRERARRATIAVTHLLRASDEKSRPFILSTHLQNHLTRRFRIQAILGLSIFAGVGITSIWAVLTRLGSG